MKDTGDQLGALVDELQKKLERVQAENDQLWIGRKAFIDWVSQQCGGPCDLRMLEQHAERLVARERERADKVESEVKRLTLACEKEFADVEKLSAACAEMRRALEHVQNPYLSDPETHPELATIIAWEQTKIRLINRALSLDCGKGWLSPERAQKLREAIECLLACINDDAMNTTPIDDAKQALEETK